jgi:hypothetical protein
MLGKVFFIVRKDLDLPKIRNMKDKEILSRVLAVRRKAEEKFMKSKEVAEQSGLHVADVSKIFKTVESKTYAENPLYARYLTEGNIVRLEKAVGIKRPKPKPPKADASAGEKAEK